MKAKTIVLSFPLISSVIFSLPIAQAATFTVTNLNDSGTGSLRQAILNANSNPGSDTIAFQTDLSGIIFLTSGEMNITGSLTINGPGANILAVSGNNLSRIFLSGLVLRSRSIG